MESERVNALIEAFTRIRDVPYATDGASDAAGLAELGRGNCLAKSAALEQEFGRLGVATRRVRWLYRLPDQPAEVALLPEPFDIHTAIEAFLSGRWVVVDATHDLALKPAGLTVVESWDGRSATAPAYAPVGPVWRPCGSAPEPRLAAVPAVQAGERYLTAYNRWLGSVRDQASDVRVR